VPYLLLKQLPRYECLLAAAEHFPELDPTAAEAFLHLLCTADEVFGVTDRNLAGHNISHGRFGVLMLLWRSGSPRPASPTEAGDCAEGPRTPAELAEAAGVTRATMTGLIDTLERDGYVQREPDLHDRRMMSVLLTSKGKQFLQEFLPGHFRAVAAMMSGLSENERKTLVTLLGKIREQAASTRAVVPAPPTSAIG
jgi:DNA-binding MarR family transcriptional regulator